MHLLVGIFLHIQIPCSPTEAVVKIIELKSSVDWDGSLAISIHKTGFTQGVIIQGRKNKARIDRIFQPTKVVRGGVGGCGLGAGGVEGGVFFFEKYVFSLNSLTKESAVWFF